MYFPAAGFGLSTSQVRSSVPISTAPFSETDTFHGQCAEFGKGNTLYPVSTARCLDPRNGIEPTYVQTVRATITRTTYALGRAGLLTAVPFVLAWLSGTPIATPQGVKASSCSISATAFPSAAGQVQAGMGRQLGEIQRRHRSGIDQHGDLHRFRKRMASGIATPTICSCCRTASSKRADGLEAWCPRKDHIYTAEAAPSTSPP